jgi:hypothetical protein
VLFFFFRQARSCNVTFGDGGNRTRVLHATTKPSTRVSFLGVSPPCLKKREKHDGYTLLFRATLLESQSARVLVKGGARSSNYQNFDGGRLLIKIKQRVHIRLHVYGWPFLHG